MEYRTTNPEVDLSHVIADAERVRAGIQRAVDRALAAEREAERRAEETGKDTQPTD